MIRIVPELRWPDLQKLVERVVFEETIHSMIQECLERLPNLWGEEKPTNFLVKAVYIAIYKDMTAIGYGKLHLHIQKWFPLSLKSLQYNTKKLRVCFKRWARKQVIAGKA